ncbi:MAG: hypothetical protein J0I06_05940 [Planctomycetes bacterium]|nr:hypothetical protein [Planctomycetota bacterium]
MPVRVSCTCGKHLQVPDAAAGKKVRCPACQAVLTVPADAPRPAFGAGNTPKPVAAPNPPRPKPLAPAEEKPAKEAMSLDDDTEEPAPKRPATKPAKAMSLDDEDDEPSPKRLTKRAARREDSEDEDRKKAPRKKRPLWVTLLALGCGGFLLLTCVGGSLLGGFLYYLDSQRDKVVGKWVVDEGAAENAALSPLHRAMQFEFDKKDMRCSMRALGIEFVGKWRVIRNRENDAILVLVDFDEARGPDGQKVSIPGKEKSQAAFEITPVDASHIDFVDVKERSARMRMKKVDAFDKSPGKAEAPVPDKPVAKKPDDPPGPKYPLVLRGNSGPLTGLTFTTDGSAVVTAGDDGKVRVFDATTGAVRTTLSGHTAEATGVFALPEGGFVTTGGSLPKDVGEVFLWGPTGGAPKQKLHTSKNRVYAITGTPDGKLLVWDDYVHTVLWDRETGSVRHRLPGISKPKGLALSRDGKRLPEDVLAVLIRAAAGRSDVPGA